MRLRLPGAVAHEQSAATSGVILFTGVFTLGSWLPSGFGVMLTVFSFESCFDLHKRHSAKTADAEWCQCVFVLTLPNSRSTRERVTGKPSACCWLGLV